MDTIRTFVAVELPAEIRKRLADTQAQLRGSMGGAEKAVRWSRVEGVHLTLQFLGDVPPGSIDAILGGVRSGCAGAMPVDLILGSVGAFPTVEKPRVLWLGLDGDTARLQTLQASIAKHLSALGYQPDKPFRPHITLGRVRDHATRDELAAISRALQQAGSRPVLPASFTAHEVSLMRSDLKPIGAVYMALGVVKLGR
jgi:RNA 2',3'-cyclic 3'-phosphodiesterase